MVSHFSDPVHLSYLCNMLKLIWELFLWYLLYKFIFGLVIPVYRTTRHVKRQMNDMQEKFNQQQAYQQQTNTHKSQSTQSKSKPKHDDDYIEFEEVR